MAQSHNISNAFENLCLTVCKRKYYYVHCPDFAVNCNYFFNYGLFHRNSAWWRETGGKQTVLR